MLFAGDRKITKGASTIAKWNPRLKFANLIGCLFPIEKISKISKGAGSGNCTISVSHGRPMFNFIIWPPFMNNVLHWM